MGMEFDQYDTPRAAGSPSTTRGEVLAGIRLTPTTARCGIYSYMIRDAQRGLLATRSRRTCCTGEAPVERGHLGDAPASSSAIRHPADVRGRRFMSSSSMQMTKHGPRAGRPTRLLALIPVNWAALVWPAAV